MPEDGPLSLGFGKAASGFFAGLLGSHGIEFVTGDGVTRFDGEQRVETVVTESGKTLDADLVVIGIGAHPDIMLARAAGLELGESGGVKCSSTLETSAAGIWCAGDPCEYDSVVHRRRLRVEHFEVAAAQGHYAAKAMTGTADGPYDEVPYFWSDLADWTSLEYVGPAAQWDSEVVLGSLDDGEFTVFYLDGRQVAGALTVGRSDDLEHAKRFMTEHAEVTEDDLRSL
jgi:3-phenylpropionate/trans-cinnamate dioxygenase ferredoxin reductase subunit